MESLEFERRKMLAFVAIRQAFAGWMEGLEFELWGAIIDGPFRYGRLELTATHIAGRASI